MKWGALSMVDGERRLLANALLDPATPTFVLLCKESIPLLDFNATFEFITQAPKSFLSTSSTDGWSWSPEFLAQVPKEHRRRGSAWFTLQRRHAEIVIGDSYYYGKFQKMALPEENEEHYFQTLLSNVDGGNLTYHSLMSRHWRHEAKAAPLLHHPRKFSAQDITPGLLTRALGLQCREGAHKWQRCSLFARRFAGATLQPLMKLLPLTMPASVRGEEAQGKGEGKGGEGGGRHVGGQGPRERRNETEASLLCPEDEALFARALATEPASGAPRGRVPVPGARAPAPGPRLGEVFSRAARGAVLHLHPPIQWLPG